MSREAMENEEKKINNALTEWTVEKFLDMRKELLDRQKDLEKSNLEMVEKVEKLSNELQEKMDKIGETLKPEALSEVVEYIRLSDEKFEELSKKFDSIQSKLDELDKTLQPEVSSETVENNHSAVSTAPDDSTQNLQENEEIVLTSGKYFVLKHTFNNVSSFENNKQYFSEKEEHFGVPWQINVKRCDEFFELYLWNSLRHKTEKKWNIDVEFELNVVSPSSREKKKKSKGKICYAFKSDGPFNGWGYKHFIEWDKLEKDFVVDDCFCAEIAVNMKKMTGIYKENLRRFDKTMEEYSDVVLIVNDEKFYVLKLQLVTLSPYFEKLFMEKLNETEKTEITLYGIDADDFQKYLEVLYGKPAIDEFTVEGILMVAEMYETRVVMEKCENFLEKESKKKLKTKLQLCNRYNLFGLMQQGKQTSG